MMDFAKFRNSKAYDVLTGLPLMLWFGHGALQLRPVIVTDAARILSGAAPAFVWLQACALTAAACFNLLLVWLVVVRRPPVRRSTGLLPRLCAVAGTFLGVGILHLPPAPLGLAGQSVAAALILVGSAASVLVLARLGRAFSILPEAREMVTAGPYAYARHPLYAVEIVTLAGTALQFAQPWAVLIAVGVVLLLAARSHFEEQVLSEAYPGYAAYRARVKRFGLL